MNPQGVQSAPKRLTQEALNKEFTIKFTRSELNIIYNLVNQYPVNSPFAQLHNPDLLKTFAAMEGVIAKIKGPVVALSNQDYEEEPKVTNGVAKQEIAV